MGKIREIKLTEQQRQALEAGFRSGERHAFRIRCQLVLLKHEGRTSKDIALITTMTEVSVNSWLNRYEQQGMEGLHTKAGRGRKPILNEQTDKAVVCKAVQQERQHLSQAKTVLEKELNKQFSQKTLKRFLKSLVAATNASESD